MFFRQRRRGHCLSASRISQRVSQAIVSGAFVGLLYGSQSGFTVTGKVSGVRSSSRAVTELAVSQQACDTSPPGH
jgi:hypothetical protein